MAISNNHAPPVPAGECIYGDTKVEDWSPTQGGNASSASLKKAGKRTRDGPSSSQAADASADAILRAKDEQIAQLEQQLRHLQFSASAPGPSSVGSSLGQPAVSPDPGSLPLISPTLSAVPGLSTSQLVPPPDPMLELAWSGYPKDLPPPDTVQHLSEIFFASSPYRNILYKPNFMASLLLPLNHPNRPHAGLLHAIMAVAVPLSPFFRPKDDSGDPARKIARIHKRIDLAVGMDTSPPTASLHNKRDVGNLSFGEYHLALARQKSETALLTGSPNPMDWCQAMLLVSYQLRVDERALEAYLMAACVAKISTPAGLTRMHAYRKDVETLTHAYLTPPNTALEEHERRNYFWHLYIIEAYTSGGVLFFHSTYDDKSISTTFPIHADAFQRGLDPIPNPQNLHSPDLYTNLENDDDFLLHLKSAILSKRAYMLLAKYKLDPSVDVTEIPEFAAIEHDTLTFLRNMPSLDFSTTVQVDRLVAVLNVHTIIVHLYQDMKGSHTHRSDVLKRLHQSVALVVQIAHNLNASNFDMGLLHFRTFNGLGVIAKVICHEINDTLSAPSHEYWANESTSRQNKDVMLIEALQALDAILMVLRRSKSRIPYAGRFEALLSKFRSGGWDNDSIERSMTVYHIYRAHRDSEKDAKPDPNSGKTGDLWTADDRMSDSWRLHTTKYDRSHNIRSASSSSPSVSSDASHRRNQSTAPVLGFTPLAQEEVQEIAHSKPVAIHAAQQAAPVPLDPLYHNTAHHNTMGLESGQMDPYGPGPYYYTPHPTESYAPPQQQHAYPDAYHDRPRPQIMHHQSYQHAPQMMTAPAPQPQPHYDPAYGSDHRSGSHVEEHATHPASLYSTEQHWPHDIPPPTEQQQQEHIAAHQTTLQNQADLLSRWNFF